MGGGRKQWAREVACDDIYLDQFQRFAKRREQAQTNPLRRQGSRRHRHAPGNSSPEGMLATRGVRARRVTDHTKKIDATGFGAHSHEASSSHSQFFFLLIRRPWSAAGCRRKGRPEAHRPRSAEARHL